MRTRAIERFIKKNTQGDSAVQNELFEETMTPEQELAKAVVSRMVEDFRLVTTVGQYKDGKQKWTPGRQHWEVRKLTNCIFEESADDENSMAWWVSLAFNDADMITEAIRTDLKKYLF